MNEKKRPSSGKQEEKHVQPAGDEPCKLTDERGEHTLSRKSLTFYVIGLFTVAIALILISYVLQARSDRQLESLSDQLSEQTTAAQGATQKMEDLQKRLEEQQKQIDGMKEQLARARDALGLKEDAEVTAEAAAEAENYALFLQLMMNAESAARAGNWTAAEGSLWLIGDTLGVDQLKPTGQGGLLTEAEYKEYQALNTLVQSHK